MSVVTNCRHKLQSYLEHTPDSLNRRFTFHFCSSLLRTVYSEVSFSIELLNYLKAGAKFVNYILEVPIT